MNHKFKGHGQDGFIQVKHLGQVDKISGQKGGEKFRKPQKQSGKPHGVHAQKECQVIEFFPVGKSIEPGDAALSEKIPHVLKHVLDVLNPWEEGLRTRDAPFEDQFEIKEPDNVH